ncbi:hypothetical protein KQI65_05005 [bacterium]|nr:hypothetical protein [bacterium]
MLFAAPAAMAQLWPQDGGYTYMRLGLQGFQGNGYHNLTGEELPLQRLEESTWKFYSEYGYSRFVTGIVSLPAYRTLLVQENVDSPVQRVEAPGDIELGLRIGIWPGDHDVILLSGIFGIPIGETASEAGLWSGDDEYDQAVMLGYGHEFAELHAHVVVQGGYHFRNDGYSDEIMYEGELQYHPWSFLEVLFRVRYLESQENGDPAFSGGRYGFGSNNRRFLRFGPELSLWVTDSFGVLASVSSLSGAQNMPSALQFSTGVFLSVAPTRRK